jgi:hypothetical protein
MPGKRRPATLPRPGLALPGVTGSGGCRTGRGSRRARSRLPSQCWGWQPQHASAAVWSLRPLALPLFTLDGHGVVGDRRVNEPPTRVNVGDRPVTEPMRCHRGGSWAMSATVRFPAAVGDPGASRVVEPGSTLGDSQGGCARRLHRHVAALRTQRGIVVGAGRWSAADAGVRGRPDRRDRDTTRVGCDTSHRPSAVVLGQQRTRATHAPPRSWTQATCRRARRPGSPSGAKGAAGPPGFTYEVQLLGGEAGRRLAQQQTEAIAELLAWLAGHPPTPPAAAGPAATAGEPVGPETGDAGREAAGPAEPGRGSGCEHAARTGGREGAPTPKLRGSLVPATSRLGVLAAWWRNGKSRAVGNGPVASGRCCAIARVWSVRSR